MHQDLPPRNVLIDSTSGNLKIFDFDRAAKSRSKRHEKHRDDVGGVIYTVCGAISKSEHYQDMSFAEQLLATSKTYLPGNAKSLLRTTEMAF